MAVRQRVVDFPAVRFIILQPGVGAEGTRVIQTLQHLVAFFPFDGITAESLAAAFINK